MYLRKIDHCANYRLFPIQRRVYASLERRGEREKIGDLFASQVKSTHCKKFFLKKSKHTEKSFALVQQAWREKNPRNASFE